MKKNLPEISISLDPSMDKNLEAYLEEVNRMDGVSVHLDVMRKSMVGHDRCTMEQYRYVMEHSRHPVDVHIMAKETLPLSGKPRCVCTHIEEMLAANADRSVIIVMSVKPGKSGQSFDPTAFERIKKVRKDYPNARIIVDGGINAENIAEVKAAGANTFVVGSFICSMPTQKDRAQAAAELVDIVRK